MTRIIIDAPEDMADSVLARIRARDAAIAAILETAIEKTEDGYGTGDLRALLETLRRTP